MFFEINAEMGSKPTSFAQYTCEFLPGTHLPQLLLSLSVAVRATTYCVLSLLHTLSYKAGALRLCKEETAQRGWVPRAWSCVHGWDPAPSLPDDRACVLSQSSLSTLQGESGLPWANHGNRMLLIL